MSEIVPLSLGENEGHKENYVPPKHCYLIYSCFWLKRKMNWSILLHLKNCHIHGILLVLLAVQAGSSFLCDLLPCSYFAAPWHRASHCPCLMGPTCGLGSSFFPKCFPPGSSTLFLPGLVSHTRDLLLSVPPAMWAPAQPPFPAFSSLVNPGCPCHFFPSTPKEGAF